MPCPVWRRSRTSSTTSGIGGARETGTIVSRNTPLGAERALREGAPALLHTEDAMGSNGPLFSVVLPTYNRAGMVMDAVESVLAQTYTEFDLVIVDDRSTDDTQSVLAAITDPRVTVVANARSKGSAGARNTGIFLTDGAWICQIDSDDLWPVDMLEGLAAAIGEAPPEVGIVYGTLVFQDTADHVRGVRRAEKAGQIHALFLEDHFLSHCSAALRAADVKAIGGYDESFSQQEDSDFLIRLTSRCEALPVPELMYIVREGGADRLMENPGALPAFVRLYKKHAAELVGLPQARYRQLAKIFDLAIICGDVSRLAWAWPRLLPSVWRTPAIGREFLGQQKRAARLVVGRARHRAQGLRAALR